MGYFEFPHTRTYDSDLGWLIKKVASHDDYIKQLDDWLSEYTPKIDEILDFMNQLEKGNLPAELKNAIYSWATQNLLPIVAQTLKAVVFGLTDDGHFIATYTDSWKDIQFNTTEYDIWLPLQPEYGHLTLSV